MVAEPPAFFKLFETRSILIVGRNPYRNIPERLGGWAVLLRQSRPPNSFKNHFCFALSFPDFDFVFSALYIQGWGGKMGFLLR